MLTRDNPLEFKRLLVRFVRTRSSKSLALWQDWCCLRVSRPRSMRHAASCWQVGAVCHYYVAKIRHVPAALHSLDDALGNAPRKDRRGRLIFADFRCLATVKAILPSTMRLLSSGLRDKELHCVRRSGCRLGSHSQPDANESSSCMTRPYLAAPLCREGTNDCWEGEFPRSGGIGARGSLSLSAGTFVRVQTRIQNQSIHP